jgi:hypothetical protein
MSALRRERIAMMARRRIAVVTSLRPTEPRASPMLMRRLAVAAAILAILAVLVGATVGIVLLMVSP